MGRVDGKIVVGPHLLGRFVIDRGEAVDAFFGRKKPKTKEMAQGEEWHRKLGYTNDRVFEKEVEVEGERVLVRGVPDYIDENTVEELKTVATRYVSNRYLEAAEVQMLAYLWLTDRPNGRVVFVDRRTGEEVESFRVFRNDEKLFRVLGEFVREVKRRERLLSDLLCSSPGR